MEVELGQAREKRKPTVGDQIRFFVYMGIVGIPFDIIERSQKELRVIFDRKNPKGTSLRIGLGIISLIVITGSMAVELAYKIKERKPKKRL